MKSCSSERDERIKEILDKRKIDNFWHAYKMFTEDADVNDLTSFEDCLIHFGYDTIFENMSTLELIRYSNDNDFLTLIVKIRKNEIHPKLDRLVSFCNENKIDTSDLEGATETITVRIKHEIIIKYIQGEYKNKFGTTLTVCDKRKDKHHGYGYPDDLDVECGYPDDDTLQRMYRDISSNINIPMQYLTRDGMWGNSSDEARRHFGL